MKNIDELQNYAKKLIYNKYKNIRVNRILIDESKIHYRIEYNFRDEDDISLVRVMHFDKTEYNNYIRKLKIKKLNSYDN